MPIRVDQDRTPAAGASTNAAGRSRRRLVAIIAAAVVLAVVVGALVGRCSAGSAAGPATPPPSTASSQPPPVEPAQATALPRSTVVAGSGGIGRIFEMRTGFTKDTNGAVQAAMNYAIVDASPAYYNQKHYDAIQAAMYTTVQVRQRIGYRQEAVIAKRKYYDINAAGQPLTDNKPDPRKKIWDAAYLQYGAYKIIIDEPEQVRVQLWYPIVQGTDFKDAKTTANIRLDWVLTEKTVEWVRGDWLQSGNGVESDPPKPADLSQVVTSFAERAKLLGTDGWTLPENAAEVDTPELKLPGR